MIHFLTRYLRSILLAGIAALAVVSASSSIHAQSNNPFPELGWDFNFNHTDAMMGVQGGINIPAWNASVLATFKGRLGSKRVLIEAEEPNLFYQYRERRYILGIQAEKRFLLTEFSPSLQLGAFLGGLGGLGISDYRGTKGQAPVGFAYSAMGGPYLNYGDAVIFRLGYQYLPLKTQNVFDHRILVSLSILISS